MAGNLANQLAILQALQKEIPPLWQNMQSLVMALPKGVANRNFGMRVVMQRAMAKADSESVANSVLYFADDDNTYDLRLFDEIRKTKRVSVFPVGLIGKAMISSPIVAANGTVIDFYEQFRGNRTFMVDMAGFAINVKFLLEVHVTFI